MVSKREQYAWKGHPASVLALAVGCWEVRGKWDSAPAHHPVPHPACPLLYCPVCTACSPSPPIRSLTLWALQGAKEDAEAVGKGADAVMHKAVAAAEQLPGALEQLPGTAGAALPALQARAEAAAGVAKEKVRALGEQTAGGLASAQAGRCKRTQPGCLCAASAR